MVKCPFCNNTFKSTSGASRHLSSCRVKKNLDDQKARQQSQRIASGPAASQPLPSLRPGQDGASTAAVYSPAAFAAARTTSPTTEDTGGDDAGHDNEDNDIMFLDHDDKDEQPKSSSDPQASPDDKNNNLNAYERSVMQSGSSHPDNGWKDDDSRDAVIPSEIRVFDLYMEEEQHQAVARGSSSRSRSLSEFAATQQDYQPAEDDDSMYLGLHGEKQTEPADPPPDDLGIAAAEDNNDHLRVLTLQVGHEMLTQKANILSSQEKGQLRLVAFCDKHNCTRGFSDKLNQLLQVITLDHGYKPGLAVKRDTLSDKIMEYFGSPGRKPVNEWATLPAKHDYSRCLLIPPTLPKRERDHRERLLAGDHSERGVPRPISTSFRNRVLLVRWNVKAAVEHLHNDISIFGNLDNLVVNPGDDRWLPYKIAQTANPTFSLDEVLDGRCYKETVRELGLHDKFVNGAAINEFISPLMFYLDKTGTDIYQRYPLEPWVLTSAVIRRFLRYHPWAWRLVGFVPDLDRKSSADKGSAGKGKSTADYHFCIRSLLEGLEEITREGFLTWIRLGDQVKRVKLFCPVFLILNDGKSADTLVCRYGGHHQSMGSLSNRCPTDFEQARDPCHQCSFHQRETVIDALAKADSMDPDVRAAAHEQLKSNWSIHSVHNALLLDHNVDPLAKPRPRELGMGKVDAPLFRTIASDLMHMNDHGLIPYTVRLVIDPLPPLKKFELDKLVDDILVTHRSSLRSQFPRTNFAKGFTNLTLITASEWVGCAYTLLLLLSTDRGQRIMESRFSKEDLPKASFDRSLGDIDTMVYAANVSKQAEEYHKSQSAGQPSESCNAARTNDGGQDPDDPDDLEDDSQDEELAPQGEVLPSKKRKKASKQGNQLEEVYRKCSVNDILQVLEALLCYYGFYKREAPIAGWCHNVRVQVDGSIRKLLSMLRFYLPRSTGNGWSLQKFHANTHLPMDMDMFGLPQNYNCGQGESGLKFWAKFASKTAQQRGRDVFVKQTGDRIYEFECYSDALQIMGYPREVPLPPEKRDPSAKEPLPQQKLKGSYVQIPYNKEVGPGAAFLAAPRWSGNDKSRKGALDVPPALMDFLFHFAIEEPPVVDSLNRCLQRSTWKIQGSTRDVSSWKCFTECDIFLPDYAGGRRCTFRAHPNYHNEGPWYDWAMVKFRGEGRRGESLYPSKLLAFIEGGEGDPHAPYAVVHTCTDKDNTVMDSVLVQHWILEYNRTRDVNQGVSRQYKEWHKRYNSFFPSNLGVTAPSMINERAFLRLVSTSSISHPVEVYQECSLRPAGVSHTSLQYRTKTLLNNAKKAWREQQTPLTNRDKLEDEFLSQPHSYLDRVIVVKAFDSWGNEFTNLPKESGETS